MLTFYVLGRGLAHLSAKALCFQGKTMAEKWPYSLTGRGGQSHFCGKRVGSPRMAFSVANIGTVPRERLRSLRGFRVGIRGDWRTWRGGRRRVVFLRPGRFRVFILGGGRIDRPGGVLVSTVQIIDRLL